MLEDLKDKIRTAYIEKIKGECVFCRMLEEEHEKIIYTNEEITVFPPLKSGALKEGHLLVIPREHHKDIFDMTDEEFEEFFSNVKSIADDLRDKSRYTGVNLLSANGKAAQQSINHVHVHMVLREDEDNYDIWPGTNYKGKSFENVNKELSNLLQD
ncbi:MAG: HIT family protein [Candidatus Nanosalina sp.]